MVTCQYSRRKLLHSCRKSGWAYLAEQKRIQAVGKGLLMVHWFVTGPCHRQGYVRNFSACPLLLLTKLLSVHMVKFRVISGVNLSLYNSYREVQA